MAYFPLFIDLENKKCVVIGGGKVAARKALKLAEFGADVTVIAPKISDKITSAGLHTKKRAASEKDIAGAFLVICATDDKGVNKKICDKAKKLGILCDSADDGADGSFIFPSIVRKGDAVLGITTSGKSPTVSKYIKKRAESVLPENLPDIIIETERIREAAKSSDMRGHERKQILADITKAFMDDADLTIPTSVKIGARKSRLAVKQAEIVGELLKNAFGIEYEIVGIASEGDIKADAPLASFETGGIFCRALEQALIDGKIDIAVHSAKDLGASVADGLEIAGIPERAAANDVLITRAGTDITDGGTYIIGTSSARRAELVGRMWQNAEIKPIRGNIDTRIEKLKAGEYDAIILARAGFDRLGISMAGLTVTDLGDEFVPAATQGIIAAECKADSVIGKLLMLVSDSDTRIAFETERYIQDKLGAGCHDPAGVYASIKNGCIHIRAFFRQSAAVSAYGSVKDRFDLADRLMEELREERI